MEDRRRKTHNPFNDNGRTGSRLVMVVALGILLALTAGYAFAADVEPVAPLTVVVTGESEETEVLIRIRDGDGFLVAARRITVEDDGTFTRALELAEGYRGTLEVEQINVELTE